MEIIPNNLADNGLENYLGKVSSRSKVIYWIIIVFMIMGIALLPFVYVDVSVQSLGFFQSEIEKQVIYAPFQGKVIFTKIENGREINKGDTLFIIDSEAIKAQYNAIQKQTLDNNSAINDLEKLVLIESAGTRLLALDFATRRYFAEYYSAKNQNYFKELNIIRHYGRLKT